MKKLMLAVFSSFWLMIGTVGMAHAAVATVPPAEPAMILLFGAALISLTCFARRFSKS